MRIRTFFFACSMLGLAACAETPTSVSSRTDDPSLAVGRGIPSSVTVDFGRDNVGSPFPPPSEHDASGHARDKMFPRTVVLRAGGTVTFNMGTFHQVAIYDQGVEPSDIDVSQTIDLTAPPPAPPGTVVIPDFLIDDATNRLEVGPFSFAPMTWTSSPGTFTAPGKYLVICQVFPHFVFANMYAWVIVK